jgi:hypothetical protein
MRPERARTGGAGGTRIAARGFYGAETQRAVAVSRGRANGAAARRRAAVPVRGKWRE